jgi:hypothetical protein
VYPIAAEIAAAIGIKIADAGFGLSHGHRAASL